MKNSGAWESVSCVAQFILSLKRLTVHADANRVRALQAHEEGA
ncbi:MAG: hypothetical protein V1736_10760 [Pseudomonadota bacterium]